MLLLFSGTEKGASLDSDRNQEECFRLCCQATGDVLPVVHLALQDSQVYHLEELQVVVHRRHPPHPTHHLHHPLRLQRACTYSLLQQQAYALPHYAVHPGTEPGCLGGALVCSCSCWKSEPLGPAKLGSMLEGVCDGCFV